MTCLRPRLDSGGIREGASESSYVTDWASNPYRHKSLAINHLKDLLRRPPYVTP
jgi:hypothetical protein